MLCSSIVIQMIQIQLFNTSWLWDIQWKPYIDIFPRRPPCIYKIWPTEVKSYNSCTAITHFLTPWHIPSQKSLWELLTQNGTDSQNLEVWLIDYYLAIHNTRKLNFHEHAAKYHCLCGIDAPRDLRSKKSTKTLNIFLYLSWLYLFSIVFKEPYLRHMVRCKEQCSQTMFGSIVKHEI